MSIYTPDNAGRTYAFHNCFRSSGLRCYGYVMWKYDEDWVKNIWRSELMQGRNGGGML